MTVTIPKRPRLQLLPTGNVVATAIALDEAAKGSEKPRLADDLQAAALAYFKASGHATFLRRYVAGELPRECEELFDRVPEWVLIECFSYSIAGRYPLPVDVYDQIKALYDDVPRLCYDAATKRFEQMTESKESEGVQ